MAEITFDIVKQIGVLSTSPKGWSKELNLVSWNGRPPRYDLREWDAEHQKMAKGVTLSDEEAKLLRDFLVSEIPR